MIGIDMEHTDRFKHWQDNEYKRIFTDKEIEYANKFYNKAEHFCGFFCVKEAFVKALDNKEITYQQIEILHTESGKPYINRTPYINTLLKEHFFNKIEISISHCKDQAIAVVEII